MRASDAATKSIAQWSVMTDEPNIKSPLVRPIRAFRNGASRGAGKSSVVATGPVCTI